MSGSRTHASETQRDVRSKIVTDLSCLTKVNVTMPECPVRACPIRTPDVSSLADLGVMARDAKIMRGEKPFLFADLRSEKGKEELLGWLRREVLFV